MWVGAGKLAIILFCALFAGSARSYGLLRTSYGSIVQWPGNNSNRKIYLTPVNSHGIDEEDVKNIFAESVSQWNSLGNIQASAFVVSDYSTPSRVSRNDAYFSDDPIFFSGSGVLAVTQITFREVDGIILESDIVFKDITTNDNFFRGVDFVTAKNDYYDPYIGGVMTHELGHFLGLGHSQVLGATMFYVNRRGQHKAMEDDRAGMQELYGKRGDTGSIFGSVIGGKQGDTVGILGSHVKVISMRKGQVVAGGFSGSDGTFSIPGLDLDDTYYLYVEPTKNSEAIPNFYSTAKRDFCNERASYQGSFFQSCNSSEKGYPQGVDLTGSKTIQDIGGVSIRCGLDTPTAYDDGKSGGDFEISVVNGNHLGNSFVGSFDYFDVQAQNADVINIDLEDFDVPSGDYYLELKVVFQSLYSKYKLDMRVESDTYDNTFTVTSDEHDNPVLDIVARVPLETDSSNNQFTLTLTPENFSTYLVASPHAREGEGAFFPNSVSFYDNRMFYLLMANVARKTGTDEYTVENFKKYNFSEDNSQCPDGKFAYSVEGNINSETGASNTLRRLAGSDDQGNFISCGTVDIQGGGGGNLTGILTGFFLMLCLSHIPRRVGFARSKR